MANHCFDELRNNFENYVIKFVGYKCVEQAAILICDVSHIGWSLYYKIVLMKYCDCLEIVPVRASLAEQHFAYDKLICFDWSTGEVSRYT